ncbi:formyltransferase family protein [Methylophaga sp.]|uniref:formyltransferase family protein n=1 Tax=Methylophaga sp. TaxID=2024840 RepID=UPI003A94ED99
MARTPEELIWWKSPRNVSVIVDNDSWILDYANQLVSEIGQTEDHAVLYRSYDDIQQGDIAFFLGCTKIAPEDVLSLHKKNLVVHESKLPKGRGFSPLTWQVLAGENEVVVSLLEMSGEVDAGPVVYRSQIAFQGHELCQELRLSQGNATLELCLQYLRAEAVPVGEPQAGDPSYYPRRRPNDSELNVFESLAEQFELLRVVDNERYPAFFDFRGHRYQLKIEKVGAASHMDESSGK